jgi:RCC1 and BTB domain-containing protein
MNNIYNWISLHKLKPEFVYNINLICVFGDEVIVVSKDDNVYVYGNNNDGILGLGHKSAIELPTKVNELCNKQVVNISLGDSHVVALTKTGQCYSWGDNTSGQLGITNNFGKPKCIESLINKNIVGIGCGFRQTFVLSNAGEMYGFGFNSNGNLGIGSKNNQSLPVKINGFGSEKIIAFSCGCEHTLALSESKKVFGWGHNSHGQLGIGDTIHRSIPTIIDVNGEPIKKIACGYCHSILLTTEGGIFTFGLNNCGQIGNGNNVNQIVPFKINNQKKFIDIISEQRSNITIAMSEESKCFVWGETNGRNILTPEETHFTCIYDVMAFHSKRKITFKPMHTSQNQFDQNSPEIRVYESISGLFNDSKDSDFKFKINGKYIFVHKLILKTRCEHFRNMFSNNWCENQTNEVEMTDYSYEVYYAFLKYIYTDKIDVKPEEAIELLDIANSYLEKDLKRKCISIINTGITIENVCSLYSLAIKYESQALEDKCFEFASNKFNQICKTDGFDRMDESSVKKFIKRAAFKNLFSQ